MTPCIIAHGKPAKNGYIRVYYRGRSMGAHQAAWIEENGPIPAGLYVCHSCDVRPCRNVEHLFLGTHLQNQQDMKAKGRSCFGAKNGRAKLTEANVREIVARMLSGESMRSLALEFGSGLSTIKCIRDGKSWLHVTGGTLPGRRYPKRGFGSTHL